MEHVLPPHTKPKLRILSYLPEPDDNDIVASIDDCVTIFKSAIKNHRDYSAAQKRAQLLLWREQCVKGRKKNLCHALLDQLYFGLLLKILGPGIEIADFTARDEDGVVYLTTAKLESHLYAWKQRVDTLEDENRSKLKQRFYFHLEQTAIVLTNLSFFISTVYGQFPDLDYYADDDDYEPDPLGVTQVACVVLHQALVQACGKVLGITVRASNSLSLRDELPWLKSLMQFEGWCPSTVFKLYRMSDVDELVFGYEMGTLRASIDGHEECVSTECVANHISSVDGEVSHVNSGCGCWLVEAPMDDIEAILKTGDVPILRISTDDGYKLSLEARRTSIVGDAAAATKYIAISHVWADRLGSPGSNIIAQCQLTRIADRLGRLEAAEHCGELCIWMDTLCIPVDPDLQELRDLHIARMHDVYKHAYAVMIMDADTLHMSQNASLSEVGMRLHISAWCARLWTYQEGALNERVLVITATGVIDLDQMLSQARERDASRDALSHDLVDKMLRATYPGLGRPQLNREQKDWLESDDFAQSMLQAICNRTTSRPDDETIIIATALDLDVSPILAASPQDRMATMLKTMPFVPANVLFTLGPRLDVEGLRWAPKTFLHSNDAFVTNAAAELVPMTLKQLREDTVSRRPKSILNPNGPGLRTFNPAIAPERLFKPESSSMILTFELFDTVFDFYGMSTEVHFDDHEAKKIQTKIIEDMVVAGRKFVILLSEFDPYQRINNGVLVELDSEQNFRGSERTSRKSPTKARYGMPVSIANRNYMPGLLEIMSKDNDDASWRDMHEISPPIEADEDGASTSRRYVAEWIEPRFWLVE